MINAGTESFPTFPETDGVHPGEALAFIPSLTPEAAAQIAAGIPVQGATVAEPGNAPVFDGEQWVTPVGNPVEPVDNAPDTEPAVAVPFDTLDREKLEYLYDTAVKVRSFIDQITPQQVAQVQKAQDNPVLKRLLGTIMPGL